MEGDVADISQYDFAGYDRGLEALRHVSVPFTEKFREQGSRHLQTVSLTNGAIF